MRALHILPNLRTDAGGPSQSVPELCRVLATMGLDVTLQAIATEGMPAVVAPIDKEPIAGSFSFVQSEPLRYSSTYPQPDYYRRLRQSLAEFDIVQLNGLWNPAISLAALACRRANVPYVISARGMLQRTAMSWKRSRKMAYYWLWERATISGADAIHFFTEADAWESRHLYRSGTRTVVIPNGVDSRLGAGIERGAFRSLYPRIDGRKIILTVGRLHWSKGLDVQCDAVALLARENPDFVWVLIGPDQGEQTRLEERLDTLGVGDRVLWTGLLPRRQCLNAMADADVFVLSSRHEAHSMAMNEALALACPVVISDSVQYEALSRYGAGAVVPRRPIALAEAIGQILCNDVRAAEMAAAARRLVEDELSWTHVASSTAALYEDIIARRRPSTL